MTKRKDNIEPDKFYTIAETAGFLPFGDRNIRRLIVTGKLPATNVGAGEIRCRWHILGYDIIALKAKMTATGRRMINKP